MSLVFFEDRSLGGHTIWGRQVALDGTGAEAFMSEGGAPDAPDYHWQELPVRGMMRRVLGVRKRPIRYAGPFQDGCIVIDSSASIEEREAVRQRREGEPHPEFPEWRLWRRTDPTGFIWVRADGEFVQARVEDAGEPRHILRIRELEAKKPLPRIACLE